MNKVFASLGVVIVLGILGFYAFNAYIYNEKQGDAGFQKDYKNVAYTIDDVQILLVDGVALTEVAPGSASKTTTQFFGNEAEGAEF